MRRSSIILLNGLTVCFAAAVFIGSAARAAGGTANGAADARNAAPPHTLTEYLRLLAYEPVAFKRSDNGKFLLEAGIGGKTLLMLADTGSPRTTLDPRRVRGLKTLGELHLKLVDAYLGKLEDPSILMVDSMTIGRAQFLNQPARAAELESDFERIPFDGILGLDFLLRNHCLIDCGDHTLYFRGAQPTEEQARAIAETLRRSGFSAIPMRCSARLSLDTRVNGQPSAWMVDTGASFSILDDAERKRLGLSLVQADRPELGSYLPRNLEGLSLGLQRIGSGTRRLLVTTLPVLTVGPRTWRNVPVGTVDFDGAQLGERPDVPSDLKGIFGDDLLMAHGALIDLSSGTLWLRPDPKPRA